MINWVDYEGIRSFDLGVFWVNSGCAVASIEPMYVYSMLLSLYLTPNKGNNLCVCTFVPVGKGVKEDDRRSSFSWFGATCMVYVCILIWAVWVRPG